MVGRSRIVVVGAGGQLGGAVVREFAPAHDVTPLGHGDLDTTDDRRVAEAMARLRPDAIINCAAYNDVDGAEDDPAAALNVNAFAVRALAAAAVAQDAVLVHYSTDFVFDGITASPYTEQDRPNPRSAYAISKLLGEWFAADAPRHYLLRVESLFGRPVDGPARGTVAAFYRTLIGGGQPRAFEDRTVSPTHIADAARATRLLLEARAPSGVYHCVNSGWCTWVEFASEMARQMGIEPRVTRVRMADVTLRAQRPAYCALSNHKLQALGISMPSWRDGLARYVAEMRDGALNPPPSDGI